MAQGYYYYGGFRDYENALLPLEPALKAEPSNSELLTVIGYVKRRQGKMEEAAEILQKSSDLDPQSSKKAADASFTYGALREWDEALRAVNRAIFIDPNRVDLYYFKMSIELNLSGSLESTQNTYTESKAVEHSGQFNEFLWMYELYLLGNNDIALAEVKDHLSQYLHQGLHLSLVSLK